MIKLLVGFLFLFASASIAEACKPRPLEACARQSLVNLEKSTFNKLDQRTKAYQKKLDKHLARAIKAAVPWKGKPLKMDSCFNNHFAVYYLDAMKSFSRSRRGMVCSAHLDTVSSQIMTLIQRTSPEYQMIREERARQDLLNQAMDVSEALLYFKNKHTK